MNKFLTKLGLVNRLLKLIFVFVLFGLPLAINAQNKPPKQQSLKKRMKELEKKEKDKENEEEDVAEYLREKHLENQTKEVRKRMKKSRKKARRNNRNRKEFFLIRWFRK